MRITNSQLTTLCVVACALFLFSACGAESSERPRNYDQVKALLDVYAYSIDMMDERLLAARKSLHEQGENAVPALIALFKDNADVRYRITIIAALHHNRGSKKAASDFLAQQLTSVENRGSDGNWVPAAIRFFATHDAERARVVARKALNAESDHIKQAAVNALSSAGTSEDVALLKTFANHRKQLAPTGGIDSLSIWAEEAATKIQQRVTSHGN